jgi:thiol-disulfide isomerase/thioredoxin
MTKKKKKKESWKEKRRQAAIKHQKALEAERLRREREPKKNKGWSKGKIFGVAFMFLLIIGIYGAWQYTQPTSNENNGLPPLYVLTDSVFSEFRGKVVVVDCFATWCQPCLQEIPHLAQINEKYNSSEVVVISVGSSGDSAIKLRQFKQDHNMTWRVARDTVGVLDKYNVEYIPTLVILSQGCCSFSKIGGSRCVSVIK